MTDDLLVCDEDICWRAVVVSCIPNLCRWRQDSVALTCCLEEQDAMACRSEGVPGAGVFGRAVAKKSDKQEAVYCGSRLDAGHATVCRGVAGVCGHDRRRRRRPACLRYYSPSNS